MCYVGIFKYNFIVKEENDDDESNSDSVPAYTSCGKCGKMFPTKVTLAQHMIMQHEEENEGNNDNGEEESNDSDEDSDVTMNTDTLEVPKKCRTRGLSKQNTAPESRGTGKNQSKGNSAQSGKSPKGSGG